MRLWQDLEGVKHIKPIEAEPWRVVEAQHILSARDLVDSAEEHDLLEELLEASKPAIETQKHYLLYTPFRYPPLDYGSRFGSRQEPSLWYGSLNLETAFAEVAFYRRKFLQDSEAELGYLEVLMTAYRACLSTSRGVDLTALPFVEYQHLISHPAEYSHSQALGQAMRESGVEAFLYYSARSEDKAVNIGAYFPSVFYPRRNQYVNHEQTWLCMANHQVVEFRRVGLTGDVSYVF